MKTAERDLDHRQHGDGNANIGRTGPERQHRQRQQCEAGRSKPAGLGAPAQGDQRPERHGDRADHAHHRQRPFARPCVKQYMGEVIENRMTDDRARNRGAECRGA